MGGFMQSRETNSSLKLSDFVANSLEGSGGPSLVPDCPIDFYYLGRLCGHDESTMREVLEVFDLQTDVLLAHIMSEPPKEVAARAHTLAVSAQAAGALKVAECAIALEKAALAPGSIILTPAVSKLVAAVMDAQMMIAEFLAGSSGSEPSESSSHLQHEARGVS
jgi:hypothetical protein